MNLTIIQKALILIFFTGYLSACQVTGRAEDVVPGVDIEVSKDAPSHQDGQTVHCPPGQAKKNKC